MHYCNDCQWGALILWLILTLVLPCPYSLWYWQDTVVLWSNAACIATGGCKFESYHKYSYGILPH